MTVLLFLFINLALVLAIVIIGISRYNRLTSDMKLLFFFMVATFIVESFSLYLAYYRGNNNWLHNIFLPIQYVMLVAVFQKWQRNKIIRNIFLLSVPVFLIADMVSIIAISGFYNMNGVALSLSCVFYAAISSFTLYNLEQNDSGLIYRDYRFWICSGLLIYSAGNLSFFAFIKLFPSYEIWYIHIVVNIATYILYGIGFLCNIRR